MKIDVREQQGKEILGVRFDLVDSLATWDTIRRWRAQGHKDYITLTPAISIMLCRRDEQLRSATMLAGLTLPDSVGVIIAARILGYPHHGRVPGPDLMLECCDWGRAEGYNHYFYGGAPGVADRLAHSLCCKYPGLRVVGTYCPPFRDLSDDEDAAILERINNVHPDIVWVGLGTPKQEKWMANHVGKLRVTTLIGVGAAFDFHSGNTKRAPIWIRKIGLEWFCRFIFEPKHRRRFIYIPKFILSVTEQRLKRRV